MRAIVVFVIAGLVSGGWCATAGAQQAPSELPPPDEPAPNQPNQYNPPPTQYQPPPPTQYQPPPAQYNPPTQYNPPPTQYQPPPTQYNPPSTQYQPGYANPAYTPPPAPSQPGHFVSSELAGRWHRARVLAGLGEFTGLLGDALTISGIIVVAATGYPCDPNDLNHQLNPKDTCNSKGTNYKPSKPTDAVPMLGYLGSSTSALGFVLTAAGLGYQHHVLKDMGVDPDRGVFHAGTSFGVFGFAAVGTSYFFGLTHYLNPHDQGVAVFASTVIGTGLCALGSLLYAVDSSRTKKAWERLSTF